MSRRRRSPKPEYDAMDDLDLTRGFIKQPTWVFGYQHDGTPFIAAEDYPTKEQRDFFEQWIREWVALS
jgi:hypothetical protein